MKYLLGYAVGLTNGRETIYLEKRTKDLTGKVKSTPQLVREPERAKHKALMLEKVRNFKRFYGGYFVEAENATGLKRPQYDPQRHGTVFID